MNIVDKMMRFINELMVGCDYPEFIDEYNEIRNLYGEVNHGIDGEMDKV